mmetsp:Transcript_55903/g.130622  ORF Transcript_55903/g.130622 Transcript_55903/m.130622 type:complete len:207 (+) Transcript_55903:56-676(+)
MVRIDYTDTIAFTQRIDKEKAAKAAFAQKSGQIVALTDQPERWLWQTVRELPAEEESPARDEVSEVPSTNRSDSLGPEGIFQAWLSLTPDQREESGLRLASRAPRPPERREPRRSGPLQLSGRETLAQAAQEGAAQTMSASGRRAVQQGPSLQGRSVQRTRSHSSLQNRRQASAPSSVTSLRPEFWSSGLRRSHGFMRVTRGNWAP